MVLLCDEVPGAINLAACQHCTLTLLLSGPNDSPKKLWTLGGRGDGSVSCLQTRCYCHTCMSTEGLPLVKLAAPATPWWTDVGRPRDHWRLTYTPAPLPPRVCAASSKGEKRGKQEEGKGKRERKRPGKRQRAALKAHRAADGAAAAAAGVAATAAGAAAAAAGAAAAAAGGTGAAGGGGKSGGEERPKRKRPGRKQRAALKAAAAAGGADGGAVGGVAKRAAGEASRQQPGSAGKKGRARKRSRAA